MGLSKQFAKFIEFVLDNDASQLIYSLSTCQEKNYVAAKIKT